MFFDRKKMEGMSKSWGHTSVKKAQGDYFENKNIAKLLPLSQKCPFKLSKHFWGFFLF
jgi:hypothetical protein